MTYVTEQTSAELRAHMRRLQAMPGWHNPLDDRLFKEVVEQDKEIERLRAALTQPTTVQQAEVKEELQAMAYSIFSLLTDEMVRLYPFTRKERHGLAKAEEVRQHLEAIRDVAQSLNHALKTVPTAAPGDMK